jgi:hypothetical protein
MTRPCSYIFMNIHCFNEGRAACQFMSYRGRILSLLPCLTNNVIPAQAGIHTVFRRGAGGVNDHERTLCPSLTGTARPGIVWIPACAGMTMEILPGLNKKPPRVAGVFEFRS